MDYMLREKGSNLDKTLTQLAKDIVKSSEFKSVFNHDLYKSFIKSTSFDKIVHDGRYLVSWQIVDVDFTYEHQEDNVGVYKAVINVGFSCLIDGDDVNLYMVFSVIKCEDLNYGHTYSPSSKKDSYSMEVPYSVHFFNTGEKYKSYVLANALKALSDDKDAILQGISYDIAIGR